MQYSIWQSPSRLNQRIRGWLQQQQHEMTTMDELHRRTVKQKTEVSQRHIQQLVDEAIESSVRSINTVLTEVK